MVSFVIYEEDKCLREKFIRMIDKFFFSKPEQYKIYEFGEYNSEVRNRIRKIESTKIFILSIDMPNSIGCSIARDIRTGGDLTSPVILTTKDEVENVSDRIRYILFLDLIHVNERMIFPFMRALKDAYKIVTRYSAYSFSIFDEIYRIPYDDIYFIQKNLKDNTVTIYTKNDSYLHYITIKGVEAVLKNDPRFLKVYRSCILNVCNVRSYDKKSNTVYFNNGMYTNLISKHRRSKLALRLRDFNDKQISGK